MPRQYQLLVGFLFLLPATLPARAVNDCKAADFVAPAPCNGISVGEPKVFDNRTLTLMLESSSATLQSQQNQFIDQKTLAIALGLIQGFRSTETASNLNITATPSKHTTFFPSHGSPNSREGAANYKVKLTADPVAQLDRAADF